MATRAKKRLYTTGENLISHLKTRSKEIYKIA